MKQKETRHPIPNCFKIALKLLNSNLPLVRSGVHGECHVMSQYVQRRYQIAPLHHLSQRCTGESHIQPHGLISIRAEENKNLWKELKQCLSQLVPCYCFALENEIVSLKMQIKVLRVSQN